MRSPTWKRRANLDGATIWQAKRDGTTYTITRGTDGFSVCDGFGGAFGPFQSLATAKAKACPREYLITYYQAGSRLGQDTDGAFYPTKAEAVRVARLEIGRVRTMPLDERVRSFDWAVRFSIKRIR